MDIFTYDPAQVTLEVAQFKVQGWTKITVKKNAETFSLVPGIRGKNTRRRNLDSSLTITVEVLQTAITNDVFSEIVRQDRITGNGRLEVFLKDVSGKSFLFSGSAFIKDYPVQTFTADIDTRTWEIVCLDSGDMVVGSNEQPGIPFFDQTLSKFTGN